MRSLVSRLSGVPRSQVGPRSDLEADLRLDSLSKVELLLALETHYQVPLPADRGSGLGAPRMMLEQPVRSRIPIWCAAIGEKSVAQTAEIADGWLPLFLIPEYHRTFGELSATVKHALSHRARALAQLRPALRRFLLS